MTASGFEEICIKDTTSIRVIAIINFETNGPNIHVFGNLTIDNKFAELLQFNWELYNKLKHTFKKDY